VEGGARQSNERGKPGVIENRLGEESKRLRLYLTRKKRQQFPSWHIRRASLASPKESILDC